VTARRHDCDDRATANVVGVVSRHLTSTEQRPAASAQEPFDRSAFERLFRECAGDVHGYAISLLGDRAGAEDVTALAFERLYRSRARLDRSRGTPRAWLFGIARNAALDELRRRRRQSLDVHIAELIDGGEPSQAIEHAERRATVQAALRALAPREREVVLLKFPGQLTNGELARVLGISESNAGTRVHRALVSLRATCAGLDREEVA
jgi:RNA polymerase sigma-70 factor, ECF subfamily